MRIRVLTIFVFAGTIPLEAARQIQGIAQHHRKTIGGVRIKVQKRKLQQNPDPGQDLCRHLGAQAVDRLPGKQNIFFLFNRFAITLSFAIRTMPRYVNVYYC